MHDAASSSDIRELVATKLGHLKRRRYYELLGVSPDATVAEIDRQRLALLRRLAVPSVGAGELHRFVQRLRLGLDEARSVLCDPDARAAFDRSRGVRRIDAGAAVRSGAVRTTTGFDAEQALAMAAAPTPSDPEDAAALAKRLHLLGAQAFARREMRVAERLFRRAVELAPGEPAYHLKLGWAILRDDTRPREARLQAARAPLEEAVVSAPYDATTRYCMASYWREAGDAAAYERELQAVLRCDDRHAKARQDLQTLRDRQAAAAARMPARRPAVARLFNRRG